MIVDLLCNNLSAFAPAFGQSTRCCAILTLMPQCTTWCRLFRADLHEIMTPPAFARPLFSLGSRDIQGRGP